MVRSEANVVLATALLVSTLPGADFAGEAPAVVHYPQVSKFDNPAVLVQRIGRVGEEPREVRDPMAIALNVASQLCSRWRATTSVSFAWNF